MSRTTSFGPSVSIRPSNLARAVNVNTPKPSPIKRAVNVNTPAPAATPKTSTPRPPFTSYRGGNISPVTGCPAGQISIAGTCVAIPTYSTPASNSPAADMQTIRDKICAVWPNDPICKLTNQTPAEMNAKVRSKVKNMMDPAFDVPVTSSIPTPPYPPASSVPTPPVTKPYPAASSVQDIRDKICAENPEACKPYPINERGLPIAAKKLQSKYCEDHPDSELCKINNRPVKTLPITKPTPVAKRTAEARKYCVEHPDNPVCKIIFNHPASPASEQPNNEPGTPANTNPPANVPDSSASG